MAYSRDTAPVLSHRGYESDTEFVVVFSGGLYDISEWRHADTKPSPEQIQAWRPAWLRSEKQKEIDAQTGQPTTQDLVRDPRTEDDLIRELSAASDKTRDLQNTPDEDVEAFDTTLDVRDPQEAGVEYNNFAVTIAHVTPWVGAPDNDVGFMAELHILTDAPSIGDQARLIVKEAPSDVGAVLPFVQDGDDPAIWTCQAREGHKWLDPEEPAAVQLLWGAGSLPVSPVLRCEKLHDRQATPVRYGVSG